MMFKYMCLVLFITWYQLADCHPAKSDVKSIDSMIDKESEAFLSIEADDSSQKTVRDKRTIGFLRQLFPNFSQIVDRKIQQITRFLFRVIGRLVLRGGAGGGAQAGAGGAAAGGGESGGTGGRRISITLPTFPPSADDEDEEQSTDAPAPATPESVESRSADAADTITSVPSAADSVAAASADSAADTAAVTAEAPTTVTAAAAAAADSVTTTTTTTTTTTAAAAAAGAGTTNAAAATNSPTTQRPSDSDNTVGTVMKRTAREASTEETSSAQKRSPLTDTENNEVSSDNALQNTNDAQTETEEDSRNKRFLLNLRGGGGGGGGSGNFLFDLIRRGADRAARAAGGFYRVVAGTDPNTLTFAQPLQYPSLVAGSGANQDREESADATPLEAEAQEVRADLNGKEDGYSVGVPGPLTRIFVIANRGVANLVQDLILRLAQTTERLVNFKARLITSLI